MKRSLIIMAALLALGCEPASVAPPADQAVRPARIQTVDGSASAERFQLPGTIQASTTIDLAFEVPGTLAAINATEGASLAQGAVIAELKPAEFQLAVRAAEAQLRLVLQDYERKADVYARGALARSSAEDAAASVDLARVRLAQAQKRLRDSRLTAPFDAQVLRRLADNHANVQAGAPIVRIASLDDLVVAVAVPTAMVSQLQLGSVEAMEARFSFLPGRAFPLTLREQEAEANAAGRTFTVHLAMARPDDLRVLPGMPVEVHVTLTNASQTTIPTIPLSALATAPDGSAFVWVTEPDGGPVTRRSVQTGAPSDTGVPILSGLELGEAIVTSGAAALQPGMSVRPLKQI